MDSKLSYDMYMEILSRTSLKTLCTMRCTSKDFEKLTYDPHILNQSKKRNDIVSGILVSKGLGFPSEFAPAPESNSLDLGCLPEDATILASSEQGIIVFKTPPIYWPCGYHVCKPATKQVLALPNPKTKYLTESVALVVMGSTPLHYKIIRLTQLAGDILNRYDGYTCTYHCEIFDSKAWAWRVQDHRVRLPPYAILCNKEPVTTKGSIYMIMTNNGVLKFDAYSEKWTTLSRPIQSILNSQDTNLVKYRGKLGFACRTPSLGCWEIWVLRVDQSWEKLHDAIIYASEPLVAICDSDMRVMWVKDELEFYKFNGGDSCIGKVSLITGGTRPEIFPIRSDFEPADLRGGLDR